MIFLESHLTASAHPGGKLPPSFLLLCPSSSARPSRVFRFGRNFPDRIGRYGRGNASTSRNVRFHYDVTTSHGRDKSARFAWNASMIRCTSVKNLKAFLLAKSSEIVELIFFLRKTICDIYIYVNIPRYCEHTDIFNELSFRGMNSCESFDIKEALLWQNFNLNINCFLKSVKAKDVTDLWLNFHETAQKLFS